MSTLVGPIARERSPPRPARVAIARARAEAALVWATLVGMLLLDLSLVYRFGANCPVWDEWALIPQATGEFPTTLRWLWSPHGEHRIPLARALYVGLMRLSRCDVRSVMVADVAMLGAAAWILVTAMRWSRGRTAWSDALIPLVIFSPGQYENLLWAFQTCMIVWALLFAVVVAIVVRLHRGISDRLRIILAAAVLLFPLCGGPGFLVTLPLALWLLFESACAPPGPPPPTRRTRVVVAILATSAVILLPLYLRDLGRTPGMIRSAWSEKLRAVECFLSNAFLPDPLDLPRPRGPTWLGDWRLWSLASALLLVATIFALIRAAARDPARRRAILGLVALGASFVLLAAGVGAGRAAFGSDAARESRYMTLASPLVVLAYASFELHGPTLARRLLRFGLVVAVIALTTAPFPFAPAVDGTYRRAVFDGARRMANASAFETDVARGATVEELAAHHGHTISGMFDRWSFRLLAMLHRHGAGPFRDRPEPLRHLESGPRLDVPIEVLATNHLRWDRARNRGEGVAGTPSLTLDLGTARSLLGVRITFRTRNPATSAQMQVSWGIRRRPETHVGFDPRRTNLRTVEAKGEQTTITVWICDTIDTLGIEPDLHPCEFELERLELLLPR